MGMVEGPRRFQVWLVTLDPTRGSEIRKTRPCAVVSPDEMNRHLRTVIVAPMTTSSRPYPTRVGVRFQGKQGQIALDQIRTVDKSRLIRQLGALPTGKARETASALVEMFAAD
jgi:mRNA interferase MazF